MICVAVSGNQTLGLDHYLESVHHAYGFLQLNHRSATGHFLFNDANGTLDNIDGRDEILLLCREICILFVQDLCGSLEVSFIGCNARRSRSYNFLRITLRILRKSCDMLHPQQ